MKNRIGHAHSRQPRNLFQWHINTHRFRRGGRVVLHVEKLESRSLLAGDLGTLDEVSGEPAASSDGESASIAISAAGKAEGDQAGPLVDLILQFTKPDGSPLTSLSAGQDFVLHVLADDLRDSPHGVFSAYLDLRWNGELAVVSGPLEFSEDFPNLQLGDASISPGVIEEGGAFGSLDETGAGAREIFSVPLRAIGAGELVITSDASETPINQVLAYGLNRAITPDDVSYGETSITIAAAPPPAASSAVSVAAAPAAEQVDVLAVESVVSGDGDNALEQLILETLMPAAAAADSSVAPAECSDQSAPASSSAPNIAVVLAGAKLQSASGIDEEGGDSADADDDAGDDSDDVDAATLNLL
jgi:hypothetical protein